VYAMLSTGLEQDRTGARNNDEKSPLAADSVWQAARRAGLEVNAVSTLPWWRELFPDGFSRYDVATGEDDCFARAELADLNLVHAIDVDAAGHAHGAASHEYAAAAQRVDRELATFLARIDFAEDLVVLTSDHGHTSYGGHGGPEPELTHVLTCFAGRGVARRANVGAMDARSLGPALAFFMGLPFPKTMRAVEDDLDVLFDVADPSAFSLEYLADRRDAIRRFRASNEAALAKWLDGEPANWSRLYARERRAQMARLALGSAVLLVAFALVVWRRGLGARGAAEFVAWAGLSIAVTLAVYAAVRGSLDFTSINARREFLVAASTVCAGVGVVAGLVHRWVFADARRLARDRALLAGLGAGALLVHVLVYGWPLGFPLPGAGALFFPFLAPIFVAVHAALGAASCVTSWRARP
jgi:hypothetical protein